jgi:flagellar biogenesis protein FliO
MVFGPAPPMPERAKGSCVGIVVVVVLLLVIMPALIYFIGWGVTRFVKKAPARRGSNAQTPK